MTPRKKIVKGKEEVLLSKEEVYNVLEFAKSLYQGIYTPDLVSSRMKDITMSPQKATMDGISKALESPKDNEQSLIGYSEYLELTSMLFKRVLGYFSGLMSFDWNYVCTTISDEKEYNTPAYKKDLGIVRDFFDKFNVKESFRTCIKQMMRAETYYGIFRDDGDRYILQELPQQYCKITGRFDWGLLYDYNLYWFLQPGVSLDLYPPIFKKMFNKMFGGKDITKYNPAASLDNRTGNFVYWTQTNPRDGFIAFKLFPEIATNIPFLSPFMMDVIMQPYIRSLQTDSYIAEASKIIAGQVGMLKDAKVSIKDQISLDPSTLGKFLQLIKSGLPSAIKVIAAPLENISSLEFDGNNDLYDSYLSTAASSAGINSRLLYSKDRQNVLETKESLIIDTNILKPVYSQFENALEYWVNQRTKKHKFKFILEGFETSIDRDMRFERVNSLADSGIVLEQKFASAMGLSPFDFRRMLEETKSNKFVEKLTPILKSNQMPGNAGAGAPKKSEGSLSGGGADSRASGTNDEKAEE